MLSLLTDDVIPDYLEFHNDLLFHQIASTLFRPLFVGRVIEAGSDSGFGAKPAPGMINGFLNVTSLPPDNVVMVGDSLHDLQAGRAAGTRTLGVLTGPAPTETLAPLADTILPGIGSIPDWIDAGTPRGVFPDGHF